MLFDLRQTVGSNHVSMVWAINPASTFKTLHCVIMTDVHHPSCVYFPPPHTESELSSLYVLLSMGVVLIFKNLPFNQLSEGV